MNTGIVFSLGLNWRSMFLAFLLVCVATVLLVTIAVPKAWFAAVGLGALLIVWWPVTRRDYDYFSPWSFVVLAVLLGTTLRGVCMSLDWPDSSLIRERLTLGYGVEFFYWPSVVLLLGLTSLTVGYVVWGSKESWTLVRRWTFDRKRLFAVAVPGLLLSVVAIVYFLILMGGFSSGGISAKRLGVDGLIQFNDLRKLTRLSVFVYLLLLTHFLFSGRPLTIIKKLLVVVLFALGSVVPVYTSSRLQVAWLFASTAAVFYYSCSDHRRIWKFGSRLLVPSLLILLLLHGMSLMRKRTQAEDLLSENSLLGGIAVSFLVNRNYAGLAKTAHIVHAIPEDLELQYGKSVAVWLIAPIPRALWPGKPRIHTGSELARRVFNLDTQSGIPPGLIAELYWNFHVLGVVLGCALFGVLLRAVYESFRPVPGANSYLVPVYVVGPMRLGFNALGVSLGFALAQVALDMAIMGVMTYVVCKPLSSPRNVEETIALS